MLSVCENFKEEKSYMYNHYQYELKDDAKMSVLKSKYLEDFFGAKKCWR
jgi:hypothetical protein